MPFMLKESGVWKSAQVHLKVSGVWKICQAYLNVAGVWKLLTQIYSPPSGVVSDETFGTPASVTLTSAIAVTWTYTLAGGGSLGGSVNQASGYVGTSITFSQSVGGVGTIRNNSWTVHAAGTGLPDGDWTVNLVVEN